ncbi:alpha-L-rhamnosidase C-terminal domain-containing protein [Catalinimonas niigatensis]|uniref:alpha-L-rhamnosidase C-terminal domain-containing protein n=1 Tax=Catalinimonas niigatensis TaxID=1397264 RepID=UPI0026670E1C|nr:alpha-L-rhamnosidase C-terminal domain-containing protein [Catalinimonas niigatensis]WPP50473.1 alpha-L-rhamnosidase C-terminal domain-containing protein [Catalinimonas niigatensis]
MRLSLYLSTLLFVLTYLDSLTWINASYESTYGEILSSWQKQDKRLLMKVRIPSNTTATVYVPLNESQKIKVNGALRQPDDIASGRGIFELGSGDYSWEVE